MKKMKVVLAVSVMLGAAGFLQATEVSFDAKGELTPFLAGRGAALPAVSARAVGAERGRPSVAPQGSRLKSKPEDIPGFPSHWYAWGTSYNGGGDVATLGPALATDFDDARFPATQECVMADANDNLYGISLARSAAEPNAGPDFPAETTRQKVFINPGFYQVADVYNYETMNDPANDPSATDLIVHERGNPSVTSYSLAPITLSARYATKPTGNYIYFHLAWDDGSGEFYGYCFSIWPSPRPRQ